MSEQLGFRPGSPVTGLPLKLSSATLTGGGDRSRDLASDGVVRLELSISAQVLGDIEVMLATTHGPGEDAADDGVEHPAAQGRELRINDILLSMMPDVLHLAGRSRGTHHHGAGTQSYALTLTFSDGGTVESSWSTTFDVPGALLADSTWRLTVPFDHMLAPATPPRHGS
ncbi:hypothetical protein VSH64_09730 [Amycolatopsis rhabdoformis]|uniref:Uncharacterized protein n=1 Tax=Amycolatopsis rhabdoformis TaxID=1448059 RepID=A0ABZ1ID97_9PSEU|nr:hypothetical protein [Amycolatopsis rhabdoformis]WSE32382.1 hypothetical protein VSH64_09730 [Amycolatopsis rhabdoformis]